MGGGLEDATVRMVATYSAVAGPFIDCEWVGLHLDY